MNVQTHSVFLRHIVRISTTLLRVSLALTARNSLCGRPSPCLPDQPFNLAAGSACDADDGRDHWLARDVDLAAISHPQSAGRNWRATRSPMESWKN